METMDPFQQIVDQLELESAVRRGSERNDLLPPRLEDRVLGEVGKRFSESLRTKIERGRYDPTPAETILVPKPGNTTRPAALLTLTDRVIFDAIVELLRPRIETALLGKEIVFWPRGIVNTKEWKKFEAAPLEGDATFVAVADVTGFYETIDHERLRDTLVTITGRGAVVNALIEFLRRVMRAPKGIPQGLAASDPIASAYLSPVDSAMARACMDYWRHGDDIRIAARSLSEARRALHILEIELRRVGLLVNSSKAIIMQRGTYENALAGTTRINEEARDALFKSRVGQIKKDPKKLQRVIDMTGQGQLGWDFFYHMSMSLQEVIERLVPHLQPNDMDVANRVLREAWSKRPGLANSFTREEFHLRVSSSLVQLAAGKSPLAIQLVGELLAQFPEKTEIVAHYLASLQAGKTVVEKIIECLDVDRFKTDWEIVWLLHVLGSFIDSISDKEIEVIYRIALDEDQSVSCRVEALKMLGKYGKLAHQIVRRMWNTAAPCYRPDLVAAAHYARGKEKWCESFLEGVLEDPINIVVLRHLDGNV